MLPFKGGHPKHMQSCVVYHLKCSNFNADYIDKTSRQVKRRFEEHKSGSQKDETYDSACFDEMLHIDKLKLSLNT